MSYTATYYLHEGVVFGVSSLVGVGRSSQEFLVLYGRGRGAAAATTARSKKGYYRIASIDQNGYIKTKGIHFVHVHEMIRLYTLRSVPHNSCDPLR